MQKGSMVEIIYDDELSATKGRRSPRGGTRRSKWMALDAKGTTLIIGT
jgi:hypothetical protein